MTSNMLREFPDAQSMAAHAADMVCSALEKALSFDGSAVLALSGGSTPKRLHDVLSWRPLAWSRVGVIPVDERWVALDHPGSNEAFIRDTLVKDLAAGARLTGLKTTDDTPASGVAASQSRLAMMARPPDAIVFGMGPDGHAASWFPHADGLAEALDPANEAAVAPIRAQRSEVTGDLVDRITLTLSYCLKAPTKILLMQGEAKRAAFEKAQEDGPIEDMPVRALLRATDDLHICWTP